jgi:bifunctional ADP-heptose synthase (sugar kinase/adenylyltransferase)
MNGERIVVAIAEPPEPILPARARAELAAALDCVAYVVVSPTRMPANVIDERDLDAERAHTFAQHVLARHNAK